MSGLKNILNELEEGEMELKPIELKTPSELVPEYCKSIEGDLDRPLTTCIPQIDKDLRNKLRGTVGAYIGYGGTKKSLLALQACRTNVVSYANNCTGVYSNMEMATYQMMSRLIDMSFAENDWVYNISHKYERVYEKAYRDGDKNGMALFSKTLAEKFKNMYGNNLFINSQSAMRVEDYEKLIKKAQERSGKVDMLVIDGLSMMGGIGGETECYTTNSKELKDLAKAYNVYIPLICHLSKGAEKHTRDITRFIRGSEKILDNVDFVLQFSLIIDTLRSVGNNTQYETDKGCVKFYNKRGTGNNFCVVYKFNSATLTIEATNEDIASYEVKNQKEKDIF